MSGRGRAYIIGFPPGGHFRIDAPRVSIEQSENSWPDRHAEGMGFGLLAMVGPLSPLPLRRAVQQIAHYFHREMHYDFLPFTVDDAEAYTAFLWPEPHAIDNRERIEVIGGCCFRQRMYSGIGEVQTLSWVWMHPYRRRRGLLAKAWPYFEKVFDRFVVEPPHSEGMAEFLKRKTSYEEWVADWTLKLPEPPRATNTES